MILNSSLSAHLIRNLVPGYIPTKLGGDQRKIAPVRAVMDLAGQNNNQLAR